MKDRGDLVVAKPLAAWLILVFFAMGLGCASSRKMERPAKKGPKKATVAKGPVPVYYDFKDILVPAQLTLQRDKSFVYSTPSFTTGVLVFEGRLKAATLVDFFSQNMAKDGWELRSSFRYRRTILNFEKNQRSCLISIAEFPFKTDVEIWVAPQTNAANP